MPRGFFFVPTRKIFILGCAVLSVVAGVLVLTGWYADVAILRTLGPGPMEMKPNVAVSILLIGLSILLLPKEGAAAYRTYLAGCCGAFVLLIGSVTLAQWIFGV